MIDKLAIKQKIGRDSVASDKMDRAIELWSKMYVNESPWLTADIHSLNLAAAISGEIARAVTVEMSVKLDGGTRAKFLETQFAAHVMSHLRDKVELAFAHGGMVFKPYVDGDQIKVDFIPAGNFIPLKFGRDGRMTACVFVEQLERDTWFYTRLEIHSYDEDSGVYTIQNRVFRSQSRDTLGAEVGLSFVPEWATLEPVVNIYGLDAPLFVYMRYPQANNIDKSSPLGVSCFARAVDLIRDADIQWSNLLWEFESGQRALYVDLLAFKKDDLGRPILPNKRLYRTIDTGGEKDDFFQAWSPSFREQNILTGLDAILKRIEFTCGLAYGTLSDPTTVEKTATEIAVSRQRTYATVVDAQKALQTALEQLVAAMDVWATIAGLNPGGGYSISFEFDDSIVVDKNLQWSQDLGLVSAGIMSKIEFRMRNLGETEEVATKMVQMVTAEQQQQADFFGDA